MSTVKNSNSEYHSGEGVSKSDLDLIHHCPLKYRYSKDNPTIKTPASEFGSMVHKLILEPDDFGKEYAVAPNCDRRTKAGKEMYEVFSEALGEREAVSETDYECALSMRKAILDNPRAAALLDGGETETSYYWNDENMGALCKCRPDKVNMNYIIDLKTTADASPEAFAKSVWNYRYHVQAAWYLDGYEKATGIKPDGFIFIAVEKAPPYATSVYVCDDVVLDVGRAEAADDLRIYCECTESGNWYGYGGADEKIMPISLPYWAAKKAGV